MFSIRSAKPVDVPAMHKIINDCAEFGQMLPRSLASLYENLREFQVAVEDAQAPDGQVDAAGVVRDDPLANGMGQRVVGVCGLSIVWANLAEVMALAVAPSNRGMGIGGQLVQACMAEAEQLGIRRVMTLTYEQAFFERLGFTVVDRQKLPLKVWSECVRCPKNQACDEIAMLRELTHVPDTSSPQPQAPPPHAYIIPTVQR